MTKATIIESELIAWLKQHQWLVQNGFMPRAQAVLCDPPYSLISINKRFSGKKSAAAKHGKDGSFRRLSKGFMGQTWDGWDTLEAYQAWITEWATLMLDFVYPGAVGAFCGGSRTFHRLATGLEDAGWEIFDCIMWVYGQGFPKSHEVQLGYGTALKPGYEPIILARAPRAQYTFKNLFSQFGSGALAIDNTRIPGSWERSTPHRDDIRGDNYGRSGGKRIEWEPQASHESGRYPANFVLTHAPDCGLLCVPTCPISILDTLSGDRKAGGNVLNPTVRKSSVYGEYKSTQLHESYDDEGGASRFFYTGKAPSWERMAGLEQRSIHPTVKPIQLTEWLAKLLLSPVLDKPRHLLIPFSGVASEVIGGVLSGWDTITGIEMGKDYVSESRSRIEWWSKIGNYEQARKQYEPVGPEPVEAPATIIDTFDDLPLFAFKGALT